MKTLLAALLILVGFAVPASACNHIPAQALLQGVTCPTCGATAQVAQQQYAQQQIVQQPVQQIVQQPVQYIQRQQFVQQLPVQQFVQQPIVSGYSQSLNSGYSNFQNLNGGFQNIVTAPIVTTPVVSRGLNLSFAGPFGGGFSFNSGFGAQNLAFGAQNLGFAQPVLVNPGFNSFGGGGLNLRFGGGFHGGHR